MLLECVSIRFENFGYFPGLFTVRAQYLRSIQWKLRQLTWAKNPNVARVGQLSQIARTPRVLGPKTIFKGCLIWLSKKNSTDCEGSWGVVQSVEKNPHIPWKIIHTFHGFHGFFSTLWSTIDLCHCLNPLESVKIPIKYLKISKNPVFAIFVNFC